jgi:hypothetical protein
MMKNDIAENFRQLFNVDDTDGEVDVNQLMTKQAEEGFESVPRDENFQKFDTNLKENKEEVEETRVLFVPTEEKNRDVSVDDKTTSVEDVKKVLQDSVSEPKKVVEEEGIVEEDAEDNNSNDANVFETDSSESEENVTMDLPENIETSSNDFCWHFENSLPKLDIFYQEKKKLVLSIVGNNPLPFEDFRNELKDTKIDLADLPYDSKVLCKTMVRIHEWKDRVQEMLINVNSQYFLWHRFVDLLRGLLAHVAYEKPIDKFKGLVYLHMGDVERYVAELEGIREDIEGVMKNLDGAASLASRHLTLLTATKQLPTRYADSYEEAPDIREEHVNVPLEKKEESKKDKMCIQFDSLHDEEKFGEEHKENNPKPDRQLAKVLGW